MYSPYYRQARPPDQPGQQRRFNKIQFSGHTGFALMATKAAEGNPRIELIDGNRLIEYYKMARGNKAVEPPAHVLPPTPATTPALVEQQPRTCPRCGGNLILRTARYGERAGKQFWGCSDFATVGCKFVNDIQ